MPEVPTVPRAHSAVRILKAAKSRADRSNLRTGYSSSTDYTPARAREPATAAQVWVSARPAWSLDAFFFRRAGSGFYFAAAFLAAAQRFLAAAMIRARPSGLRRRFFLPAFAGAGAAPASALAFRAAAQRLLCAAAMRLRAAALSTRFVAVAPADAGEAGCPPILFRSSPIRASMSLILPW